MVYLLELDFDMKKRTAFIGAILSLIPLGGYVKFFGDANLSSSIPDEQIKSLSEKEINETFHVKSLKQKAAIVFAGPFANFVFAFILLFFILLIKGTPISVKYLPIIDNVLENSAADKAGFKINDKIILVNGNKVTNFLDIRDLIISSASGYVLKAMQ